MKKRDGASFVGSISKLAFSTLAVQTLSILAIPVTSRLFPPEAFGAMSYFISIATIIANVSCLKYEMAVVLPKEDDEAAHLIVLGGLLTVALSLISGIAFHFFGSYLFNKGGVPELTGILWLFPVYILFFGLTNLLQYWYMRMQSFGIVAIARIGGKAGHLGSTIGFGTVGMTSPVYLIIGAFIMPLIQSGVFLLGGLKYFISFLTKRFSFAGLKKAASEHKKFPQFTSFSELLNISSQSLPFILITAFFGAEANGHFSRALALVSMPLYFLSGSIRDVLYQRASEMNAVHEPYEPFIDTVLVRLAGLVIPPMFLLSIVSTDLFVIVAGENWLEAGLYTRYLVPWLTVWFISLPLSVVFSIRRLQSRQLVYNILLISLRALSLTVCGVMKINIFVTILIYSAVGVLMHGGMIVYLYRVIGLKLAGIAKAAALAFIYSIPAVVVTATAKWFFGMSPYSVLAIATLTFSATLFWSASRDPELKLLMKRMIRMSE